MALNLTNPYDYSGDLGNYNYYGVQLLPNGGEDGSGLALKGKDETDYTTIEYWWPRVHAYWRFNENHALNGTPGEIVNYHPNTETVWNTGRLSDFAKNNLSYQYVNGKLGKALQFSGTYTVGYNNNTNMHLVELAPDLTNDYVFDQLSNYGFRVSFWIRIDASPSSSSEARFIPVVSCYGWDDNHWTLGSVFLVRIENTGSGGKGKWSRINFWWMNSSTGAGDIIRWDFNFNVGQWYYISCYINQSGHGDIWINNKYKYGGNGSVKPTQLMSGVKDNPLPLVIGSYRTYETNYNFVYDYNFTIDNLYFDSASSSHAEHVFYNSGNGVEVSQRYETEGYITNNRFLQILNMTDFDASYTQSGGYVKFFLDKFDNNNSEHHYYFYDISSGYWTETTTIDSAHTNTFSDFKNNIDKLSQQLPGFGDTSTNIGVYLFSNDGGVNSPKVDWTYLEGYDEQGEKRGFIKFAMVPFEGLSKYGYEFAVKVLRIDNYHAKFKVQPFEGLKDVLFKFVVRLEGIKRGMFRFVPALLNTEKRSIKYNIEYYEGLRQVGIKFSARLHAAKNAMFKYAIKQPGEVIKSLKFKIIPWEGLKRGLFKFNMLMTPEDKNATFKFSTIFTGLKNSLFKFTVLEDAKRYVSFKFNNYQEAFKKSIFKFKVQASEGLKQAGFKFKALLTGVKQVSFRFGKIGVGIPQKTIQFIVVRFEWTKRSFKLFVDLTRKYGIIFMVRRAYKFIDRLRYDNNRHNVWTKEEDSQDKEE